MKSINSMKVLVTGGAGFLGINLVRSLLQKGCSVISLDIANFDYKDVMNKVEVIKGDIRDKNIVDKAVKGCDIVIHAAAALPLFKKEDVFSTDIEGTRNIIEASYKHNVDRVIYISTAAVYAMQDHCPQDENDRLEGVSNYIEAKIRSEAICLEYRKKGMCIPIIRAKTFIGPERLGVFGLFYDWAKDGKAFPMIGSGNNRYQLLDVEDLCEAIYLCMVKDKNIVNDTFNIAAKEFTTMKEDYQAVLDDAGFGRKIVPFPAWPMITALRALEFFHLSPLYKWVYETASKDSFVSIEKAERILGFRPQYSNKDALVRNYRWYLKNIDAIKDQSGISHRAPWKQGILKYFKLIF